MERRISKPKTTKKQEPLVAKPEVKVKVKVKVKKPLVTREPKVETIGLHNLKVPKGAHKKEKNFGQGPQLRPRKDIYARQQRPDFPRRPPYVCGF